MSVFYNRKTCTTPKYLYSTLTETIEIKKIWPRHAVFCLRYLRHAVAIKIMIKNFSYLFKVFSKFLDRIPPFLIPLCRYPPGLLTPGLLIPGLLIPGILTPGLLIPGLHIPGLMICSEALIAS